MKFEMELEKGRFFIGQCGICKKNVWPPSDYCSKCFGKVVLTPSSGNGKIIEFSSKEGKIFCVAEFEKDVRIIGHLKSQENPQIGQKVKLEKCGIRNGKYIFEMTSFKI